MTTKLFLVLNLFFSFSLFAHEKLQTNDLNEVLTKVLQFETTSRGKNLVVFDIDNTLIASRSELGSDQWFEWQSQLIANNDPHFRIVSTMPELVAFNTKIKTLVPTRLTQNDLPVIIQTLRQNKIPVILLTSRGPDLRDNTESILKDNGIWMSDLTFNKGFVDRFIPTGSKVEASFMNGIFMTAGMHKGEALKYILKYSLKKYEHIVFADDLERHTNRVYETFAAQAIPDITTFRYGREDVNVETFKNKDKSSLHNQFINFKTIIDQVFALKNIQGGAFQRRRN